MFWDKTTRTAAVKNIHTVYNKFTGSYFQCGTIFNRAMLLMHSEQ